MSANPIEVRHRPQDFLRQMGAEVYKRAYEQGMSVSYYMEEQMPEEEYKDGLDAFSRLLKISNLRVKSYPDVGVYASKYEDFDKKPETRALLPELIRRVWRKAATGRDVNVRSIYSSADTALNTLARPYADATMPRTDVQIAPAIPVSELVATTTPIDGDAYRVYYLTNNAAGQRLVRVGEAAEIPRVTLQSAEHEVNLFKYGRALEASYESLRRQRFDRIALHVQKMAVQAEVDKVGTILETLVNGDGNTGTAAEVFNLTTLDSGTTANNLTLKAWLAFKMKFANPYMITHALAREATMLSLQILNVGSANVPLVMIQAASNFGGFRQINPGLADNVGIGWTADAPASQIVAFDRRFAIERVVEIGANISEVERFITRQTQILTMTEVEGYASMDNDAAKILNLAA